MKANTFDLKAYNYGKYMCVIGLNFKDTPETKLHANSLPL